MNNWLRIRFSFIYFLILMFWVCVSIDTYAAANRAPSLTINKPSDKSFFTTTVKVDLSVNDADTGDKLTVFYRIDNNQDKTLGNILTASGSKISVVNDIDVSSVQDGQHSLYLWVQDDKGSKSTESNITIIVDRTVPISESFVINGGAEGTKSKSVTLTIDASDNISASNNMKMLISNSSTFTSATWQTYAATKSWTLSATQNGSTTVYIKFKDETGNESEVYNSSIIYDATSPVGSVSINSGAISTNTTSVNLSITAADANLPVSQMMVSNSSTLSGGAWELFDTYKQWTLGSTAGNKTVYIKFRDSAGNESVVYNDTITLDVQAPTGSIKINNGAISTSDESVVLNISATDNVPPVKQMLLSNNSNFTDASWEVYSVEKQWTIAPASGNATVYIKFKDYAGNESTSYSASIAFDETIPSGSIKINNDAVSTNKTIVNLNILATSPNSTISHMMLSNVSNFTSASWIAFADAKTWTITSGDGIKTVYVKFKDANGKISTIYSDSITLDTSVPTGTIKINNGASITDRTDVMLDITSSDTYSQVTEMMVGNSSTLTGGVWEPYATSKAWTVTTGSGTKTVYIKFKDEAGNQSTVYSDTITLDTTFPTGTIKINSGAAFANSINVKLNLTANDTSYKVRFRNDENFTDEDVWENYAVTKNWIIEPEDGEKTVYVEFKDGAGNITRLSDTIVLDTVAPTDTNIIVNDGKQYANKSTLTITLNAEGAKKMYVSTSSTPPTTSSVWETYATIKSITYTGTADALVTVFAWFMDDANNISIAVSDDITYDATPVTGAVIINSGSASTTNAVVSLYFTKTSAKLANVNEIIISNSSSFINSKNIKWDEITYKDPADPNKGRLDGWIIDSSSIGSKTVYVKFLDWAGNTSTVFSDAISYTGEVPTGTVIINKSQTATNNKVFNLDILANKMGSFQVTHMIVTEDNDTPAETDARWKDYSTTYAYTYQGQNGTATVYVWFKNSAGNVSASAAKDTIIYDTQGPTATITINGGATSTNQSSVTLTISAQDALSNVSKMMISNKSDFSGAIWEDYNDSKANWPIDNTSVGDKTVYIKFIDSVQNTSAIYTASINYVGSGGGTGTGAVTNNYITFAFLNSVQHYQLIKLGDGTIVSVTGPNAPTRPLTDAQNSDLHTRSTFYNNDRVSYRLEFDVTDARAQTIEDMAIDIDFNRFQEEGITFQIEDVSLEKYINNSFATIKNLVPQYLGKNSYSIGFGNDNSGDPMIKVNGGGRYALDFTARILAKKTLEAISDSPVNVTNRTMIKIYTGAGGFTEFIEPKRPGKQFDIITNVSRWDSGVR